ncbi:COP9 signalosome complex subunit 7b isoform X6 [Pseudorca crassidens]|uniref:COP9 signalosome complex subunit 7b isoform X6 n=1 Tax=Pseudorca crassidens TaxID=82174 RepID=UPI00352F6DB3
MTAHREVTSICMELRNLLQIMAQLKPHFLQKASLNHSPGHSQESLICTPGAPCGIICPSQMDLSLPGTLSSPRSQDQRMAGEQKPSSNLLEQFILLAKGTSGSALTALISQVLEAPGVYVFGELLELANVQELAEGGNAAYLQLLNLFAYGTYPDYIANKESLPELSTAQQNKLKHLTIVSLASRMKVTNIKKTLKATASSSAQEMEQQLAERECPPHAEQRQPTKKMSKVKGLVSSRH